MNNRIVYINEKLVKLRQDWKVASPAMKNWILQGAKALKIELASLQKRAEKKTGNKRQLHFAP